MLENPEMLDALIGVYERNVLGYPATAVLPYSQALSRFPAHLQQADMESNGKSVNRFGEPEIGRASCRERCLRLCRSRWSPYH